eukprot:CAMPEP_0114331406 /NCGR_PEP_ID=MMETSP0101-20121206/2389_1 /TAXON_ID=38822 ORGANISM="Pteridomonas danica, Strain PT" /NCGR_SAMPLE_ID=MMETSP0101 /ASSEMBLY_ACC=CAM_ASM_000211 /LENGTH=231 /DNA_ID=CAMNT_0001461725 /DNA_START=524 /DNA_END=1216 /DNA_ORIENTATION=-
MGIEHGSSQRPGCEGGDHRLTSKCLTYREAVEHLRPKLLSEFDFLYKKLTTALSKHLHQKTVLLPGNVSAPPGFHLYLNHRAYSLPVFRMHSDETFEQFLQKTDVSTGGAVRKAIEKEASASPPNTKGMKSSPLCDVESRISFTLPIHMPERGGGGLNYLDFSDTSKVYCKHGNASLCGVVRREESKVGSLYVHNATLLHQVGHWPYHLLDGHRITLQGFGFNCGGTWYIY